MNSLSVEENERAIFPNRHIRMNCLPNLLEQRLLEEKKNHLQQLNLISLMYDKSFPLNTPHHKSHMTLPSQI